MKKKFLVVGSSGCALALWLFKTLFGGVLYATAAFFTKIGLERWGSGKD